MWMIHSDILRDHLLDSPDGFAVGRNRLALINNIIAEFSVLDTRDVVVAAGGRVFLGAFLAEDVDWGGAL